jgi:hypothetical protein
MRQWDPFPSRRSWTVQTGWGIGGVTVLILVIAVSLTNLQEIYEAQKDFVVGSLLSLVGFCFAKALSRRAEDEAIELVSASPDPRLRSAVIDRVAHDEGVLKELAVLARDVDAANARLSQYFDLRTRSLKFHEDAALLFVALEDLDHAGERISDVKALLGVTDEGRFAGDEASIARMTYIRRYLREAANRRDQVYSHFSAQLDWEAHPELAEMFSVLSSDIWKAGRALNRVLGKNVSESPEECLRLVNGYVHASLKRAEKLEGLLDDLGLGVPVVYEVLMDDLRHAEEGVERQLQLIAPDQPRTPEVEANVSAGAGA